MEKIIGVANSHARESLLPKSEISIYLFKLHLDMTQAPSSDYG